jgi:hypothetical protein
MVRLNAGGPTVQEFKGWLRKVEKPPEFASARGGHKWTLTVTHTQAWLSATLFHEAAVVGDGTSTTTPN